MLFSVQKHERWRLQVCGCGLTEGAVFILGSIDGSVGLQLQLEALAAGQPGHDPLQLGLWRGGTGDIWSHS